MPRATGGTVTYSGNYTLHTFTSSGSFTANEDIEAKVLLVGGGSGGNGGTFGVVFGNAGAGGSLEYSDSNLITTGSHPVVVGIGSVGTKQVDSLAGGDSTFNGLTAGGGQGALHTEHTGASNDDYTGGTGVSGVDSGGGAGAGQNGQASIGGNGAVSYITGLSVTYGGGGGGLLVGGVSQPGGDGGGGAGNAGGGISGTNGLGGGGGGGTTGSGGGDGGSGIVIIKYLTVANLLVPVWFM